jgi:hypothetical protein
MNNTHPEPSAIKLIQNHWVDLRQITLKEVAPQRIAITFQNGDIIHLRWRDQSEKESLLAQLDLP